MKNSKLTLADLHGNTIYHLNQAAKALDKIYSSEEEFDQEFHPTQDPKQEIIEAISAILKDAKIIRTRIQAGFYLFSNLKFSKEHFNISIYLIGRQQLKLDIDFTSRPTQETIEHHVRLIAPKAARIECENLLK